MAEKEYVVAWVDDGIPEVRGNVVRCKDCKHGKKLPMFYYCPNLTWCNKYERSNDDDWFCADGERRTDDA